MCTSCNQPSNRCYCLYCHTINPLTGIIEDSHLFNPASGRPEDVLCVECSSCAAHCLAGACRNCAARAHNICVFCAKCLACCVCVICKSGAHLMDSASQLCERCSACAEHCSCPKCATCSAPSSRLCKHCGACVGCCMGAASPCGAFHRSYPIVHQSRGLVMHRPSLQHRKILRSTRLIGVELEVNNIPKKAMGKSRRLTEALALWQDSVVRDGSIGDLPHAFEINASPSGGDLFLAHMRSLSEGLALLMDGNTPGNECGMHVHIDAEDLTVYDLSRLIRLYYKVEKAMYDLVSPLRLTNNFARVCGKFYFDKLKAHPKDFRAGLVSAMYYNGRSLKPDMDEFARHNWGKRFEHLDKAGQKQVTKAANERVRTVLQNSKSRKYQDIRYNSLNLHSYFLRKTIEFRHHHDTVDYNEIVGWSQVCQELVNFSQRMSSTMGSSTTVNQYIEALPPNSKKSLLAVMPARLHEYIIGAWKKQKALVTNKDRHAEALAAAFNIQRNRYTT